MIKKISKPDETDDQIYEKVDWRILWAESQAKVHKSLLAAVHTV